MNNRDLIHKSLQKLNDSLRNKDKYHIYTFEEFLKNVSNSPEISMRNCFQLLSDMIHYYIPTPDDKASKCNSSHYINYDCSKLFIEDAKNPFFADKLFANKLINLSDSLKSALIRNKMLLFVGPRGSGKSTFLNTLLDKLEQFTKIDEGIMYETVWEIDTEKLEYHSGFKLIKELQKLAQSDANVNHKQEISSELDKFIYVPCPSHDHPIIQIPTELRKKLLDEIIDDNNFKKKLFFSSEYEWVFQKTPCAICTSIYNTLFEHLSPNEILKMLHVRKYTYDRKTGNGITVYNPGDTIDNQPMENPELQKWLDTVFRNSNAVKYIYSTYAKTNNGVFGIMDGKSNNKTRIKNIHTIISDGIHKVKTFEESIDSLFITLINPEDIEVISTESSFMDRVTKIPIPYIRDFLTEIEIFKNVYGSVITSYFAPWVLETFSKIIISTRLNKASATIDSWIKDKTIYKKICDNNLLILKMTLFAGEIPSWLSSNDSKNYTKKIKTDLIHEGNEDGQSGISGRQSLELFNSFYSKYKKNSNQITIENIIEFFDSETIDKYKVNKNILDALINLYDYTVLQEVKESMFYYNEEQISRDIKNYLYAINNDPGVTVECPYTKDKLEISDEYFNTIEPRIFGLDTDSNELEKQRIRALNTFVSKTLQQIKNNIEISKTDQFKSLKEKYDQNLKKNVLTPYIKNTNFRRAIQDIGTESFETYDQKIKYEINYLIKNLKFKFKYSDKGAQSIALYAIDKNLAEKFPEK